MAVVRGTTGQFSKQGGSYLNRSHIQYHRPAFSRNPTVSQQVLGFVKIIRIYSTETLSLKVFPYNNYLGTLNIVPVVFL